jgi:hypothetical protein
LHPGTTLEQAQNELAVLAKNFEREYPKLKSRPGRGGRVKQACYQTATKPLKTVFRSSIRLFPISRHKKANVALSTRVDQPQFRVTVLDA